MPESGALQGTLAGQFLPHKIVLGLPDMQSVYGTGLYPLLVEHRSPIGCSETVDCSTTFVFQILKHDTLHAIDCTEWLPLAVALNMDNLEPLSASGWSTAELTSVAAFGDVAYSDAFWKRLSTFPKLSRLGIGAKDTLNFLPYLFSEHNDSPVDTSETQDLEANDALYLSPYVSNEHANYLGGNGNEDDDRESAQEEQEVRPLPFPSLQHIQVHLSTPVSIAPHLEPGDTGADSLLESFVRALRLRRDLRPQLLASPAHPLHSLTFVGCDTLPRRALVSTVSEFVGQFTWKMRDPPALTLQQDVPQVVSYNSDEDEST
ncbi:hypothetical protein NMY22_g2458 [Coprinellus aureogranulatus]|nr:hypothetical protein NMY22_g2458 [Coprinellus aureogranulatus]